MNDQRYGHTIEELTNLNRKLEGELAYKKCFEVEIIKSNKYLKTLIENALDIIMVLNTDKSIRYISNSVLHTFGFPSEAVIGTDIRNYIHPKERDRFDERFNKLLKDESRQDISEFLIRKKNGAYKIMESISKKIIDPSGDVTVLVNARDITERAEMQEILKRTQSQLLTAQKIAQLGSWEWSIEKDVFRWSKELHKIYGITSGKFLSDFKGFERYLHPNDREIVIQALHKARDYKQPFEFEYRIIRVDGRERLMHTRGEVISKDGEAKKIIATVQDITELKKAENQLREYSEQLKSFNAKQDQIIENERSQIAREIHDELGQMLAVLKMDIFLVKERAKQQMGESMAQHFKDDMQNIFQRFDTLISSVQRITTNLRPEVLQDLGLTEAILWQCRDFEQETGIECKFLNEIGHLDDMVKEYKNALFRIVQQALDNIEEHSGATKAEISLRLEKDNLVLKIWDNGMGIKDDKKQHPNALGVLSMRERSHYLGGDLSIVGKQNKGTTVELKIPLEEIIFKY